MSAASFGSWSFLIVAAGSGARLGGEPKQFRMLGEKPVWLWSALLAKKLYEQGLIEQLVAVFPAQYMENPIVTDYEKELSPMPFYKVTGGDYRSASVLNGLLKCTGENVLIHDAARPFLTQELCIKLMKSATGNQAAVPLLPSNEALKILQNGRIENLDRTNVRTTGTPQAFKTKKLLELLKNLPAGGAFDEAQVWIDAKLDIDYVEGDKMCFKITDDFDWAVAKSLAEKISPKNKIMRVGHGYDIHRLVPGRKLILGGVEIPFSLGLLGHSDADLVAHAVADALLGAAGEPDIGTLFPASSEKYKDCSSMLLLETVIWLVQNKNFNIEWVDVTLQAQVPKLANKLNDIKNNLEAKIGYKKINIKVKSGEHAGSVGRGECMICHAIATLSFEEYTQ